MKKLLCILLSCILVFNSLTFVYADEHGGSGGSFDPITRLQEEHPDWFDENGHVKPTGSELFNHTIIKGILPSAAEEAIASLYGLIGDYTKNYDNSDDSGVTVHYHDNGQPVTESTYNENNFYITYSPKFLNGLNKKIQENVHRLDGYYLIEPLSTINFESIYNLVLADHNIKLAAGSFPDLSAYPVFVSGDGYYWTLKPDISVDDDFFLFVGGRYDQIYAYNSNNSSYSNMIFSYWVAKDSGLFSLSTSTTSSQLSRFIHGYVFGNRPFKIFYSQNDVKHYINNGKKRSYVPKLPSTKLTVPLGYANGTLNLPDFNINLDSLVGKAELEIQNDIDNQFKLYLDKLAEINVNPSQPTNPTPTPSGGGSGGDFGDGTTPTPAPDFSDGLKDTNDYLKQILEKVTSILQLDTDFSKSFETVSQNLCKYLESNNEKLDQIITAINALSNGKTEDEVNGCKYDFTQLSQSLTSLWNDSDQKFDQMIKLLEENNKYQEKIIGDLNDIKAILIAQTVLDAFQNRSKETADKAKEKFPTSIPWDIAMIVNTFSAEPQPIKFELPIKVNSLNINETITVDLSTGEWEKLGKLCRYMLSVLFILFLIQLSRKLFSNGGDE